MNQQAAYLLREFFTATNWNSHDNSYASLTHSSRQLLDFAIPPGLHLQLSNKATDTFASTLNLSSLVPDAAPSYPSSTAPVLAPPVSPLLAGQLTYLYSSAPLHQTSTRRTVDHAERVRFKDVLQSYPLGSVPVKPELRGEALPTWQGGRRVDRNDYLLYGRLYAPSPRLDALYVRRLSPTLQTLVSLITVPSPAPPPTLSWESTDPAVSSAAAGENAPAATGPTSGPLARLSELEVKVQQDTGRWSAEYSYAVGDGMWGARGLYNFGRWGSGSAQAESSAAGESITSSPLPDDRDETSSGLEGRWSAGGEIYFSAQERSAGVSTGIRFTTLPPGVDSSSSTPPHQPPTTFTATLNPIMGQLSTAYAVQAGRDAALASRFDFNLYSYDADLTLGGEWYQRKSIARAKGKEKVEAEAVDVEAKETFDAFGRGVDEREERKKKRNTDAEDEVVGVLKVRASTNSDIAMLWEGRLGDFLVSLGLVANLRLATSRWGRVSPIRSVGVGISYWA
ncbi:hypothetical protein JCM11251_007303 [Rhodosporidiobolus azoricus]